MVIAAAKKTAEDTPDQGKMVWVFFPDFECYEGVLDIPANEDRHFVPYDLRERYLT